MKRTPPHDQDSKRERESQQNPLVLFFHHQNQVPGVGITLTTSFPTVRLCSPSLSGVEGSKARDLLLFVLDRNSRYFAALSMTDTLFYQPSSLVI